MSEAATVQSLSAAPLLVEERDIEGVPGRAGATLWNSWRWR